MIATADLAADTDADSPGCILPPRPYPGLRPFAASEWPVFFGRERMTDEVLARLIRHRMLFVHGDSGCGKSSLLRAGVFARLTQGAPGQRWRTAAALPGTTPLWNLAKAFADLTGEADDDGCVLAWRRALNAGIHAADALRPRFAGTDNAPCCLLIDQFEELFEHARSQGPEEAILLTRVLIGLHEQPIPGLHLAMTMRSEYLGACARFEGFAEMVNAVQYLLPRIEHEDMIRAICEPALLYDGTVSRELAERMIADVGGSQDQLPLIQHGLMRLYQRTERDPAGRWRLGVTDFPAAGGLAGLLSAHADEVMAQVQAVAGTPPRLVEDLFRALSEINAEGHAIRRRRRLDQLALMSGTSVDRMRKAIDAFRADGVSFLGPHGEHALSDGAAVDVGHEALLRCWQALADPRDGWLIREFRNSLVWRALLVQADSFERNPDNVLAPATTDERERWLKRRNPAWAERYGGGWDRVQALIAASIHARDQARANEAEALRRSARAGLMRRALTITGMLVVALITALLYAFSEIQESRIQHASVDATRSRNIELENLITSLRTRNESLGAELAATLNALEEAKAAVVHQTGSTVDTRGWTAQITTAQNKLQQPAATPAPIASSSLAPRLYVHIAEEGQRTNARALERMLEQLRIGERTLVVPGIELVKEFPSQAQLRCFSPPECERLAPVVLAEINRQLASPQVELRDLSNRYGKTATRDGHLELWFPAGPIQLRIP